MKKTLLSLLALLSIGTASYAQFGYTLTTQTGQTYAPLATGAIDLVGGNKWDDTTVTATLPFTFILNGRSITSVSLQMDGTTPYIATSPNFTDTLNAFLPLESDLEDRNGDDPTATTGASPIRFRVDGTAPNRIAKMELFNAGFYDDNTKTDSVNVQVWLYEGSNIVEMRYGGSRLTTANLEDYFYIAGAGGPLVSNWRNLDPAGTSGVIYYLTGNPSSPTVDSLLASSTTPPANGLTAYPANGTVYRFTPGTTGISLHEAAAAARALKLYPSVATATINADWNGAEGEAYQIVSATGQQVAAGRLQRGTQSISVSNLAAGTYHLRLAAGSHQFVKQ